MTMRTKLMLPLLVLVSLLTRAADVEPAREFRGAWMHIIGQNQYANQTTAQNQAYLRTELDKLKANGVNAVIFQVRPQADAAYPSRLEPWSRWLSGTAGVAPKPVWDPLQFMITEAHKRGMELHAWINPYRVTSSKSDKPAVGHIYYKHPEWFIRYADGKIYFDPGLPESRDFIDKVVRDLLKRYDIDAIHMDDYFYPYPVAGKEFGDDKSYAKYGGEMSRDDWRRHNVDLLIEQLHATIMEVKPHVRFGISPFGIWRNKKNDPTGSETDGLQCYDALYADCPLWTRKGWVDYMVPQLYWELEHKRAPTLELMRWWNTRSNGRHMYYGFSITNMMDNRDIAAAGGDTTRASQLYHKLDLMQSLDSVHGLVWWPGYSLTKNYKGVADSLQSTSQVVPALIPASTWIDDKAPAAVTNVHLSVTKQGKHMLRWQAPVESDPMQQAVRYVIYAWDKTDGGMPNLRDRVWLITGETSVTVPTDMAHCAFAVQAVDRCNNVSNVTFLTTR